MTDFFHRKIGNSALYDPGCAKIADIKPELVVHESFYKLPKNKL